MRRWVVSVVLTVTALAGFVEGCDGLFYHPSRNAFLDPASIGFPFQDVGFNSLDGTRLHGWFFAPKDGPERAKATVIHFHGNAENISTHFQAVAWLAREGFNVFVFDYRGYGQSDGKPNPEGIEEDEVAAARWVRGRPDVDPDRLI